MYLVTEGTLLLCYQRDRGASEDWMMFWISSHAHKTMIHFSVACWIPYYIFLLRFKDPILEPNGRRADVLRGHGCKPCRLIMYLVIF